MVSFVRFDAASCTLNKLPIFIGKSPLERVATPLGFEPRITPPKGAVLPLHHGVYYGDFRLAILDQTAIGKMPGNADWNQE